MRLKQIRLERNLSVAKLSSMSGVSLRTIQDIEARGDCRISTARLLCDALDCSLEEFIFYGGIDNMENPIDAHSSRVMQTCLRFASVLNLSEKHTLILLDAARLHDIGKGYKDDYPDMKHNDISAKLIIENRLAVHKLRVADVARCHRGKFNPDPRNWKLAAVLRLSDKLDRFDGNNDDAKIKCLNSMAAIVAWHSKDDDACTEDLMLIRSTFEEIFASKLKIQL